MYGICYNKNELKMEEVMNCGNCYFYCTERRICVIDEKFYFESFPSCEKYKNEQENAIENKESH
jgi:hypothetical protein